MPKTKKATTQPAPQAPKRGRGRPRKVIAAVAQPIQKVQMVETSRLYVAPKIYAAPALSELPLDQRVAQKPVTVAFLSRQDKRQLNRIEHMLKMLTKHQLSKRAK